MNILLRSFLIPVVLIVAAFAAPATAAAAPQPNDVYGNAMTVPATGGTATGYTYQATMEAGEFNYGSQGGQWAWSLWYAWTAPQSGTVRFDLCTTDPVSDEWYMVAAKKTEWPSPLTFDFAATTGCANASMPQADFTAVAGTQYRIAVGSKHTQNIFMKLRVAYTPKLATATTMIGSASVGQTLRAVAPTFSTPAEGQTLSTPTWLRCAADGSSCNGFLTQGSDTYVVRPGDVGMRIRAEYTASNSAGSVTSSSALTVPIVASPVDADGDGIPDELVTALGIPTGAAGVAALCTQFSVCKKDPLQASIFDQWNNMEIISGKLLDVLLGSLKPEILIADQDVSKLDKKPDNCDGAGGNDICIGNAGPDTCRAYIGDDFCFGNKGNDTCISKAGNDVCYGGEGADACLVQPIVAAGVKAPAVPKIACFGGSGTDACFVNPPAMAVAYYAWLPRLTCAGGAANDTCKAAAAKLVSFIALKKAGVLRLNCSGDAGNDACGVANSPASKYSTLIKAACSGGTGRDLCVAKGASDWATGRLGAQYSTMTCNGGSGNDTLWTLNGKGGDRINGGGQAGDICFADSTDIVTGCGQTLRWKVSPADLKLIDGTPAQRAEFVRNSVATLNKQPIPDERLALIAAQIVEISGRLNKIQVSQTADIRAAIQGLS